MIPNQIDRPVAAGASAGGPRLLLVEDNDDHAILVELALSEQVPGSVLERVKDGPAALRRLGHAAPQSDGPAPDVVVLDLNLPGLSGHEVLRAIKSDPRLRAMPVVVLSTSSAEGDRRLAYSHCANSYLVKPMDFDRFFEMVRELGEYWTAWNVPAEGRIDAPWLASGFPGVSSAARPAPGAIPG